MQPAWTAWAFALGSFYENQSEVWAGWAAWAVAFTTLVFELCLILIDKRGENDTVKIKLSSINFQIIKITTLWPHKHYSLAILINGPG